MTEEADTALGVTLPPRIHAQVEILALDIGLNHLPGPVSIEFAFRRGKLDGTFLKLGRLSSAELELLATSLAALRQA